MPTFTRKAKPAGIDAIHQLLDMEPFKYDENLPYERSWIEQLVKSRKCITLVYESEGTIKGFISGEQMVSGAVMVWFCTVKTEYQHKHIGMRLYFAFEEACKRKRVTALLAYGYKTSADMLKRLHFYSDDKTYKEFYKPLNGAWE